MDPTLITLIITSVVSALTLTINVFQSIVENHFSLSCSDCCSCEVGGDKDEKDTITTNKKPKRKKRKN